MNEIGTEAARTGGYTLPAHSVEEGTLPAFAAVVWFDREARECIRSSWWRYAGPECAVVAAATHILPSR